MSTINGSGLATLTSEHLDYTPFEGGEYGGRYEGPTAKVLIIYQQLKARGYSVRLINDQSPFASVEFRSGFFASSPGQSPVNANEDYTDTWELVRNTVHKELLMSDHRAVSKLNATNLLELKEFLLAPDTYDEAEGFTLTGAESFDAARYLFDLFRSGVRAIEVKQPILRWTRVATPFYTSPFTVSNVDGFLTTAQVIADCNLPSDFPVSLSDLATSLARPTTRTDELVLNYYWLKDLVSATKSGRDRMQYTIEYKYGLYDTKQWP